MVSTNLFNCDFFTQTFFKLRIFRTVEADKE